MDHLVERSDISLKDLVVIDEPEIGSWLVNERLDRSAEEQTGFSRNNRVYSGVNDAMVLREAPLMRLNLEDNCLYRHWSPESESVVGGDTLLTALDSGWEIKGIVLRLKYSFNRNRSSYVYQLELQRGSERNAMKVLENPWVIRLLQDLALEIVPEISP